MTRAGDTSGASHVDFAARGGGVDAADSVGGVRPSGTLTFAAGQTEATISVEIAGDPDGEGSEALRIVLGDAEDAPIANGVGITAVRYDDAAPLPGLSIVDADVQDEGDNGTADFDFVVSRTGDLGTASSASFTVAGDANAGDFAGGVLPSGIVSFATGQDTATITVSVAGDTDLEPAEALRIVLSDTANAILADDTGETTIRNDDAAPLPVLSITDADDLADGDAGASDLIFTVTRTGDLAGASSADFSVVGAVDAADFAGGVLSSGTVTFAAGEATADIVLAVAGDTDEEADETVTLTLSAPVGAVLADVAASGIIEDDDDHDPVTLIAGTDGLDYLAGIGADERIEARGGALDQLFGGGGADEFVFADLADLAGSRDVMLVRDFEAGVDRLDLGGATVAAMRVRGGDTVLLLKGPDRDTIILSGIDDAGVPLG